MFSQARLSTGDPGLGVGVYVLVKGSLSWWGSLFWRGSLCCKWVIKKQKMGNLVNTFDSINNYHMVVNNNLSKTLLSRVYDLKRGWQLHTNFCFCLVLKGNFNVSILDKTSGVVQQYVVGGGWVIFALIGTLYSEILFRLPAMHEHYK